MPALGDRDREFLGACSLESLVKMVSFWFSERPCLKGIRQKAAAEENITHPLLAPECTYVEIYNHILMYMQHTHNLQYICKKKQRKELTLLERQSMILFPQIPISYHLLFESHHLCTGGSEGEPESRALKKARPVSVLGIWDISHYATFPLNC